MKLAEVTTTQGWTRGGGGEGVHCLCEGVVPGAVGGEEEWWGLRA